MPSIPLTSGGGLGLSPWVMVTLPVSVCWPDQVISVEIELSVAFVPKGSVKETNSKITR